jgi:peptidoglycan/xylan/chitin deacetylase (PgdA/CDA1 family)
MALEAASAAYLVGGRHRRSLREPGAMVVLVHDTPPRSLASLERFVVRQRERIVDYAVAVNAANGSGSAGAGSIALSFDDGFLSNRGAAEMLASHGVSAAFFVPTGVIGAAPDEVDRFYRRPQREGVMGWADLDRLVELGHVVGSHSREHRPLAQMSLAEAEAQVCESVELLRRRLGRADHFAWPYGSLASAPVDQIVRWCGALGVTPASGVRGRNVAERFAREGYLRRDPVDPLHLARDLRVFMSRSR